MSCFGVGLSIGGRRCRPLHNLFTYTIRSLFYLFNNKTLQEKCQAYSFLAQRMNSDLLYDEGAFF